MVGSGFKLFAYFLSLSLYANQALARASNITFSDAPTTCSPVTISWQGGVAPFTVIVLRVDALARPGPDGTIPGVPIQVAAAGSARRVVWTAAVEAGQTLVAVVRDGQEQNASSNKSVVQASRDVACLAAVTPTDDSTSSTPALPTLTTIALPSGTSTTTNSSATLRPSEAPLVTDQTRSIALPVLLTLFTVGIAFGVSVYGFCIYRNGASRRSGKGPNSDIERGRYEGNASTTGLRTWGAYSKQLGRGISRKISALSSQISRRPTAVVAAEKPQSFTILPEESSPSVPRDTPQSSAESRANGIESSPIIGVPIMPVHVINASRRTSNATVSTAGGTTETGSSLSTPARPTPASNDKGLRPAPSKSNIRDQVRPLPVPPPLQLARQETQRRYGLPTANNRLEAMRPTSRSKSANVVEPNRKRVSSLPPVRRSASAGVVAALDSPPAHFAQVPISALPPVTPIASSIPRHSRVSIHPSSGPGAAIQGVSSRKRSNTIGSVVVVQEVPFVMASPTIPSGFNQSTDTFGTGPPTPLPVTRPLKTKNVPKPLDIPYSPSRSDEDGHVDPFSDIPQTAMTARSGYSMALPESGSLLPTSFAVAQSEVIPSLPNISRPLPMVARKPSRPIPPTQRDDPFEPSKA